MNLNQLDNLPDVLKTSDLVKLGLYDTQREICRAIENHYFPIRYSQQIKKGHYRFQKDDVARYLELKERLSYDIERKRVLALKSFVNRESKSKKVEKFKCCKVYAPKSENACTKLDQIMKNESWIAVVMLIATLLVLGLIFIVS